jgi:DNA-binding CsgD family transcriptional regulator
MARSVDDEILDRLDKILRVLALQIALDKSVTEGARLLKIAGLDNRTIADVLNTTDATVRVLTTNLRRKPKAAGKNS